MFLWDEKTLQSLIFFLFFCISFVFAHALMYMRERRGSRHISFQGYCALYQNQIEKDTSVNLII
jgi:hypothetical protein